MKSSFALAIVIVGTFCAFNSLAVKSKFYAGESGIILPGVFSPPGTINAFQIVPGSPIQKYLNTVSSLICPDFLLPHDIQKVELIPKPDLAPILAIKTSSKITIFELDGCNVLLELTGNYEFVWQSQTTKEHGFISFWNPSATERAYVFDLLLGCPSLDPNDQVARDYVFYSSDPVFNKVTLYQEKNNQPKVYDVVSQSSTLLDLPSVVTTTNLAPPEAGFYYFVGCQNGQIYSPVICSEFELEKDSPVKSFLMGENNDIHVFTKSKAVSQSAIGEFTASINNEDIFGVGIFTHSVTECPDLLFGSNKGIFGPDCDSSCQAGCFGLNPTDCCAPGCKSCKSSSQNECVDCLPRHFRSINSCLACNIRCESCEMESKCSTCKRSNV